jgi:hypothetical protein
MPTKSEPGHSVTQLNTKHTARVKGYASHRVKTGESLQTLAEQHGLTWQELARFNFGTDDPTEVNRRLAQYVGCTKRSADAKSYVFDDSDKPGLIHIPKRRLELKLQTGSHRIQVQRPKIWSRIELGTVDEFGHRVGNLGLVCKREGSGEETPIHVDGKGHAKLDKLACGKYRILHADGSPAHFYDPRVGDRAHPKNETSGLVEAVIELSAAASGITRIVVKTCDAKTREARRVLQEIYWKAKTKGKLQGRGQESQVDEKRSAHYCLDNLLLAAGWNAEGELNVERLVATVLPSFFADYHPVVLGRGYHVLLLEFDARRIALVDSDGQIQQYFALKEGVELIGLYGAYAMFTNLWDHTFYDMLTLQTMLATKPTGGEGPVPLDELVDTGASLRGAVELRRGQVQIVYAVPTAMQLLALALFGGSGRLEDYGQDEELNASIHKRNLEVCTTVRRAYDEAYGPRYVDKVKARQNEQELRELGPPLAPYEMPKPAGVSDEQFRDICSALAADEYGLWNAIALRLDDFAKRVSQGAPYLRIKPKWTLSAGMAEHLKKGPLAPLLGIERPIIDALKKLKVTDEVELETSIDLQLVANQIHVVVKPDAAIKVKLQASNSPSAEFPKYPLEFTYKTSLSDLNKQSLGVKIVRFALEGDTAGKRKISIDLGRGAVVESEMNLSKATFGGGFTFKFKDLLKSIKEDDKRDGYTPSKEITWLSYLERLEVQVQVGIAGNPDEIALAMISHAPGFFELRPESELLSEDTRWADLILDEQHSLSVLGWDCNLWNGKYHAAFQDQLPSSLQRSADELSPAERVAIVHLGFHWFEDYAKAFKAAIAKHKDPHASLQ